MSPTSLLVFPGITYRINDCHVLMCELIMVRGIESFDWVSQGHVPTSATWAPGRLHLRHADHRWWRSCFPKEVLGVITNIRKSRF